MCSTRSGILPHTSDALNDLIAWIFMGDSSKREDWCKWDEFLCLQIALVLLESSPFHGGWKVRVDNQKDTSNSVPRTYTLGVGQYV